jgi:hypothetical protein
MSTGPAAAGLLWLWATVADLGHGDDPERLHGRHVCGWWRNDHKRMWVEGHQPQTPVDAPSADEGEGCPGVVEEPMVTGGGREDLAGPGDPGPRPVRPGQRGSLRVHRDQLAAAP